MTDKYHILFDGLTYKLVRDRGWQCSLGPTETVCEGWLWWCRFRRWRCRRKDVAEERRSAKIKAKILHPPQEIP